MPLASAGGFVVWPVSRIRTLPNLIACGVGDSSSVSAPLSGRARDLGVSAQGQTEVNRVNSAVLKNP
jgi:hypothetical protein